MLRTKAAPIHAKRVNYAQDGTGRDCYIWFKHASTDPRPLPAFDFRLKVPALKNFRPIPKTINYQPNGTGRDFYVT